MPGTLGALYIVATPIGNLEDITLRALRILREVDLIAAEDTRVTRKLLSHYDIHVPLVSFHQHSREDKLGSILARLEHGDSIALVSDAGIPGISDPGVELIAAAIERDIVVVPIPGASAVLTALVASGLSSARFAFDGFPPRTKTDRKQFFTRIQSERRITVLFESPTRLTSTLVDLLKHGGDRPIAVARELTKKFEEIYRGTISGALEHFGRMPPRGEFTLVVSPPADEPTSKSELHDLRSALNAALEAGQSSRDAVNDVARKLDLPRRVVYRTLIDLRHDKNTKKRRNEESMSSESS